MPINYFLYGLTSFSMGLVVLLRGRRRSQLALGHEFYWLAAFGLITSLYSWGSMFHRISPDQFPEGRTDTILALLLALSGVVLIRFGIGLIVTAGTMPSWIQILPVTVVVPIVFVIAYAIVSVVTATDHIISAEQWTRYLLLFPGNILAAFGFHQQWKRLKHAQIVLAATGLAFLLDAFVTGAVTSSVGLSDDLIQGLTGIPIDLWRVGSLILMALLVSNSMNIFEIERQQEIVRLQVARKEAENAAITSRANSRRESERWLNALVKISQRIAAMDDTDEILADVVLLARELVHGDTATLALYEPNACLNYKYQAAADGVAAVAAVPVDNGIIRSVAETGQPQCYPGDDSSAPFTWQIEQHEYRAQAVAVVPLQLSQKPIGALWVGRFEGSAFQSGDVLGLGHFADQIVIVLEHAAMAGRVQSLAVLEERSRIAREMHDSLAQILGYLSLETQTLEALTRQHDEEAALTELAQARELIKSAQADVRENILSLRTTLAGDVGFVTALTQYVEEFGIQTGIDGQVSAAGETSLSPLIETQAVRIVQEALTNVRKHARASQVRVNLRADGGFLTIGITDNGVGLTAERNGHFGLQMMRERAESVGGSLDVISLPGQGTRVLARVPLA